MRHHLRALGLLCATPPPMPPTCPRSSLHPRPDPQPRPPRHLPPDSARPPSPSHPVPLCPSLGKWSDLPPNQSPSPAQWSQAGRWRLASVHGSPASGSRADHVASLHLGVLENKTGVTIMPSPLACFQDYEEMYGQRKPLVDVAIGASSRTWTTRPLLTRSLPLSCPQHVCTRVIKAPVMERDPMQDTEQSPATSSIPQPFRHLQRQGLLPSFYKRGS